MALEFRADAYFTTVSQQADNFIATLQGYANSTFNVDNLGYVYSPVDSSFADAVTAAAANAPSLGTLPGLTAAKPTMGNVGAITVPTAEAAPTLTMVAPAISLPARPTNTLPTAPGSAPAYTQPTIPGEPVFTLPTVPTFASIAMPVAPTISLPTFSTTMPVDDIILPTSAFVWNEPTYSSGLLDALKAKLLNDVQNGGYGIEPLDEASLWDRARERELLNLEAAAQEAARQAAARGFMLPPGAMLASVEAARNEAYAKTSSLSRDVMLKRADLYVQNRQFTIEQSKQLEDILLRHFGFMAERMLNAAKYTAEFGINLYNAAISRYNARLEATRISASLYDSQLKAALSHLEVYKAQIEGAQLTIETQKLMADVYATQLQGVNTLASIYRTRMDAARVAADVELAKLQGFKATVEAYVAQVGAKEAEFKMYTASVNGAMAEVEIYKSAVAAYSSQVDAYRSKIAANDTIVKSQATAAQITLDKYRAELGGYTAELEAYTATVGAAVSANNSAMKAYEIKVDATAKAVNAKVEMWATNSRTFSAIASVASSHILGQANAYVAHANSAIGAASAGMGGLGQAMAGIGAAAAQITAEITSA